MGRLFVHLCADDDNARYTCRSCGVDVANSSAVIWSGHMGLQKPAFLLRGCTGNVIPISPPRQERLHSAVYTLQTVGCRCCSIELGWLYLKCHGAAEQTYKEGCSLLEQALLRASPSRASLAVARQELAKMQQRTTTATATTRGSRSMRPSITHNNNTSQTSHTHPHPPYTSTPSSLPLQLSSLSALSQLAGLANPNPDRLTNPNSDRPRGMGLPPPSNTHNNDTEERAGFSSRVLGAFLGRMAQRAQHAQHAQQERQQGGEGPSRRGLGRRVSWQDGTDAMQMDEEEAPFSFVPEEDDNLEEGEPLLGTQRGSSSGRTRARASTLNYSLEELRNLRQQEAAEDELSLAPRQPSFTQGRPQLPVMGHQLIGRPSTQSQSGAPSIDTTAHVARTWIQGDPLPPRSSGLQFVHARLASLEAAPSGTSPEASAAREAALTDIDQALNMMIVEAQQAQSHLEQATAEEQPSQDDEMQDAGTAEEEEHEGNEGEHGAMVGGDDDDDEDPIEEDDSEQEMEQFRAALLYPPSFEEQQERRWWRQQQQQRQQLGDDDDDDDDDDDVEERASAGQRMGLDRSQEEALLLDGLQQEATHSTAFASTPGTQDENPEDSELASSGIRRTVDYVLQPFQQYRRLDQQLAERQLRPPQVRGRRLAGTFHFSARPSNPPALLRSERAGEDNGDREHGGVRGVGARGTRLAWPESSGPMTGRRRQIDDGAREGVRGVEAPGAGAEPIPCLPSRNIHSRTAPAW